MLARCPACNSDDLLIGSAWTICNACPHRWITERAARLREVDQAKRNAEEQAQRKARREFWASIEASNAAKADSALNRRTGKPHAHTRAKSRRLKQLNGSRA